MLRADRTFAPSRVDQRHKLGRLHAFGALGNCRESDNICLLSREDQLAHVNLSDLSRILESTSDRPTARAAAQPPRWGNYVAKNAFRDRIPPAT